MTTPRRLLHSDRRGFILATLSCGFAGLQLTGRALAQGSARIDVRDHGLKPGEDALPAITAALNALAQAGGGTLLLPPNDGGYRISDTIEVRFSPCHIELQDDIVLSKTTKASAIVFKGLPSRPLQNVSVTGIGERKKIDGNGRAMQGYSYSTGDTFYSCVLFAWCTDWRIENIYAYNGLVGCIRAFFCGPGKDVDCDASHAEYDNGHSVDFDPPWLRGSSGQAGWSRAQIVRARAWNCKGLGITSYASSGVTISDAEVWNCGNDEPGHPNNGGGMSIEGNVGNPAKPDLQDHGCTIIRATIRDCWNQGLHVSAVGATLQASRISRTRAPQNRPNKLSIYGSNIIIFGAGSLKVENSIVFAAQRNGISMRVAGTGQRPSLSFQGTISDAAGNGIFASGIARLAVLVGSAIVDCGSSATDAGVFVQNDPGQGQDSEAVDISGTISGSAGLAINIDAAAAVRLHDIKLNGNFRKGSPKESPVRLSHVRNLDARRILLDEDKNDFAKRIHQTMSMNDTWPFVASMRVSNEGTRLS